MLGLQVTLKESVVYPGAGPEIVYRLNEVTSDNMSLWRHKTDLKSGIALCPLWLGCETNDS